ncbi:MAG: riboflavin biosynthesis protein RibF, partial [Opitutae bacterium]
MAIFNQTSPVHLAIGIFDGVHLGHREILGQASRASKEDGGLVAVLTFWPHPSHVLRPDHTVPMLYSKDLRTRFLADAGADEVMYQEFTKDFASMEAEKFPEFLKNAFPSLKTV